MKIYPIPSEYIKRHEELKIHAAALREVAEDLRAKYAEALANRNVAMGALQTHERDTKKAMSLPDYAQPDDSWCYMVTGL